VPEFFVNITAGIELKTQMLAAHRSQRKWLRDQHGMDEYVNSMRAWGARRGKEAESLNRQEEGGWSSESSQVMYAEAFRQHLGHAYPRENILQSLLFNEVVLNPSY
jgi:N-acetylglucosamine malate deacetylase 1